MRTKNATFPLNCVKFIYFVHTYIYTSLTQYLSVADNAGDDVLLHVSAPSERKECGNKSGIKKRTKYEILKLEDFYVSFCIVVLFHTVSGYTFILPSCLCPKNTLKEQSKHLPKIICYSRHTKMHILKKNLKFKNDYTLNGIHSI